MMLEDSVKVVFPYFKFNIYCFKHRRFWVWDETINEGFSIDTFECVLGVEKDGLFVTGGVEQTPIAVGPWNQHPEKKENYNPQNDRPSHAHRGVDIRDLVHNELIRPEHEEQDGQTDTQPGTDEELARSVLHLRLLDEGKNEKAECP